MYSTVLSYSDSTFESAFLELGWSTVKIMRSSFSKFHKTQFVFVLNAGNSAQTRSENKKSKLV